jgi:NTE family protein
MEEKENIVVKTLVLPGGMIKGVVILGVVAELEEIGLLDDVDTYVGTSVGAVIGFLLSIGYTSEEILKLVIEDLIRDVQNAVIKSVQELGSRKFFMDNNFILKHIKKMIVDKKLDPDMTLEEHFQLTNTVVICTSHVVDMKSESSETKFISYLTSPGLRCVEALQMSFSIPFLFDVIEIDEALYVDGGVRMNIPYLGSNDEPSTLIVVVEQIDTKDFGNRSIIRVPIKLQSLNLMIPIKLVDDIYTLSKFRAKMKLVKEKMD